MLTAAASPLVQGAAPAAALKTIRVRVLRAFLVKGQRVEVGDVIELERRSGMEIVTANKAELVTEPAAVQVAAITDLKPAEPTAPARRKKQGS